MQNPSKKKNASKFIKIIKNICQLQAQEKRLNIWQHKLSKLELTKRRNNGRHAMLNCHPVRTDSFISIYRPLVSAPLPFKVRRPTTQGRHAWRHRNKIMNKVISNTETETLSGASSNELLSPLASKALLAIASHQGMSSSPARSAGRMARQIAI